MANKQFAENPLLYIQQPTTKTPQAQMQHNYDTFRQSDQQTTQKQEHKKTKSRQTRPLRRDNFHQMREKQEQELVPSHADTEQSSKQPKFSDMTLVEKINYFVDRSNQILQIRCEIQTEDQTFKGVVTGKEEEYILMRIGRRTSHHKVLISEITDIRMLGL